LFVGYGELISVVEMHQQKEPIEFVTDSLQLRERRRNGHAERADSAMRVCPSLLIRESPQLGDSI
jgi:hypothetical protein